MNMPFDCQILDLPILIIQSFQNAIHGSGCSIIVIMQKILLSNSKYLEEIIQGHESIIGIGIVELWKESSHSRRGRVGGDLVGHGEDRCEKDLDATLYSQSRSSLNVAFGYHQHKYLRKIAVSLESLEIGVCQSPGELPRAERKRIRSIGRRLTHFDAFGVGRRGSICSANNMRR